MLKYIKARYIPGSKSEKTYISIYFNIPTIIRFIFFVKIYKISQFLVP